MGKPLSVSALRANLYRLLDEVVETGVPLEVERNGSLLRIVPAKKASRLANLKPHPGTIIGDPEDMVHIDWSTEWRPFL